MMVDEGSGQKQCEDWKASGSLGQHHEESLSELDQRCMEAAGMEAASAEASGSTGSQPGSVQQPPLSLSHAPPDNESILVYASTQQISADTDLASGYQISLGSPMEYPLKQKNLKSCLALAKIKIEENLGR
jgi:hypothetical protein